jgi:predicted permease
MMRSLRAALLRVRSLFSGERQDRELTDEIESHIQLHVDDNIRAGMTPAEARRRAVLALGGVEQAKEQYRDRRGLPWLEALLQDLRFGARMLRKQKTFTAVAVATLAIGFGPPIAIFTLANWMVLRPVPGVRETGAVAIYHTGAPSTRGGYSVIRISYPNLRDVVPRLRTVSLAGFQVFSDATVGGAGHPTRFVRGQFVSGTYFDVLGVRMQAGRPLRTADDDPANPEMAVVIGDGLWATLFDRDPAAVGQAVTINGRVFTVVGVADRGFQGPQRFAMDAFWLPAVLEPLVRNIPGRRADDRSIGGYYQFVGRLAPGATWPQADAELGTVTAWLRERFPEENGKLAAVTFRSLGLIDNVGRERLLVLVAIMFGASTLVLIIASSNVASLLLMRGVARRDEVAVRHALGAGRWRVLRQHVTEATLLWLLGAIGGTLVVWAVLQTGVTARLSSLGVPDLPVPLDGRPLAFAALLGLACGLLFSLVPAWAATKVKPASVAQTLSVVGGRRLRLAPVLTVVQLSASLGLLVGALMLIGTVRHLMATDLGFNPDGITVFGARPPVGASEETAFSYVNEFSARLAATPGVTSVASGVGAPFANGANLVNRIRPAGSDSYRETRVDEVLSAEYFGILDIPIRRGRAFAADDIGVPGRAGRSYAVVNEALARQLFGTAEVVGRSVEMPQYQLPPQVYSIVGVAGDVRYDNLTEPLPPIIYLPSGRRLNPNVTVIARTSDGRSLISAIERVAESLNSPLPADIRTLTENIARARGEWDLLAGLMTILATIAGVVAAVGVYGVVAFAAASRRSEFGIRMALGANAATVRRQVLRGAGALAVAGLVLGSAAAYAVMQVLRARLVGVSEFEPAIWGGAALALMILVFVASMVPARNASRVSLVDTLKTV